MKEGFTAKLRAIGPFLLVAIAIQLLFWLVLLPIMEAKVPLGDVTRFDRIEAATLSQPTYAAVTRARFTEVETPWSDCCTRGYRAVRYHMPLDRVPPDGLLIAEPGQADNLWIYVNGGLLYGEGRMDRAHPTYHGNITRGYFVPAAMLRQGDNRIEVILVRSAMPWFDAGGMIAAPHDKVAAAFASRTFRLNDLAIANAGLAATLALLALVVALRSDARAVALWSAALLISFVLLIVHYRMVDPPFSPTVRLDWYFALTNLQPVAWFGLLTSWSATRPRWLSLIGLPLWLGMIAFVAWQLRIADGTGFDVAGEWTDVFRIVVTLTGVLIFMIQLVRHGPAGRMLEAAVLLLCVTLLMMAAVYELVWDEVFNPMEQTMGLFLLAFAIALIARNVRLFQSQQSLNILLSTQLAERTAALEAAHARETQVVRAQAHQAERQRIMRDMHDGLGSQLMSMLLMARRGEAKPPVVAEGLQSVIDEMRLMIDSMDSVGESLSSAFTIFRDRMQARVEGSGKQFNWSDLYPGTLPDYGPRDVLQVFRIMQEAVTNALKHSSGDRIDVQIIPSPDPATALRITLADNGSGMGAANPRGRGMANMAARADSIGARLTSESDANGVRIILDLPPGKPGA